MKGVVVVIAALVTLGLAAFGITAAQKASVSSLPGVLVAHTASRDQGSGPRPARPAAVPVTDASASAIAAAPAGSLPTRVAQNTAGPTMATASPPAAAPSASPPAAKPTCDKPGGMGLTRVVEIDTTGGPGFGFEHFKQYDFLREKEVVLTFDDGPWPENTPAVLRALADQCLKATFFEIGEHAIWHPEITKEVIAAGHTVGSHTWSHKDLAKNPYARDLERAKEEIEMGASAVHLAAGGPIAPFFRFPDLQHPPQMLSYLAERGIATFSTDIDSFDFKLHKPDAVVKSIMTKLEKRGKGIILMHDFQRSTAEAMPELLRLLKAGGYKVVHMVPRAPLVTLAQYDDMVMKQDKLSVTNARPTSSVVRTISE